jgi:hypothetical protein
MRLERKAGLSTQEVWTKPQYKRGSDYKKRCSDFYWITTSHRPPYRDEDTHST